MKDVPRLATVDQILKTVVPKYMDPPISRRGLIAMLKKHNVTNMKANPNAQRGGGVVWYSSREVESIFTNLCGDI